MLLSMTGYGTGSSTIGDYTVRVNLQSVNSRFLEQRFRISSLFSIYENEIRERLSDKFKRGEVTIQAELLSSTSIPFILDINRKSLSKYTNLLDIIQQEGVNVAPVTLRDILSLDDVISKEPDPDSIDMLHKALIDSLDFAIEDLTDMHICEGKNLERDIVERIDIIASETKNISELEKHLPGYVKQRIVELQETLDSIIPPERIAQEVTMILAKMDIAEEVVRLNSHISQFHETVALEPPVGTKLNFIIQEIHREANTIAAKSQHMDIVSSVIEIKEQTERIREQLRNVQ